MSKIHWHLENIPEAIRRQSIEKVVTVKLNVDTVQMFGRYFSEVEKTEIGDEFGANTGTTKVRTRR